MCQHHKNTICVTTSKWIQTVTPNRHLRHSCFGTIFEKLLFVTQGDQKGETEIDSLVGLTSTTSNNYMLLLFHEHSCSHWSSYACRHKQLLAAMYKILCCVLRAFSACECFWNITTNRPNLAPDDSRIAASSLIVDLAWQRLPSQIRINKCVAHSIQNLASRSFLISLLPTSPLV